MPYFITDKSPDCSGWATIKEDGEVLGCHTDKQSAVDQMVALSLAEDLPVGGERALGDTIVISDIDDTLIVNGALNTAVYEYLDAQDAELYLVTGRNASTRADTEAQLAELGIEYEELLMNPGGDSNSFKAETALKLASEYTVLFAVENNADARKGYEDAGIKAINPTSLRSQTRDLEEWDLLTERQQEQAEDIAGLATEFGMFNQGSGADGALYFENNPFAASGVKCGNCIFFNEARQQCQVVEGDIKPESVCKLWVIPETSITEGRDLTENKWITVAWKIKNKLEGTEARAIGGIEKRSQHIELRAMGDGKTFEGYAAVFNSPSEPLPFTEIIKPGAFTRSLKSRNRMMLLWNHNADNPLASTRNGSLQMTEDARGLKVRATLPDTTLGKDIGIMIDSGLIDSMSFGFRVKKDSWSNDGATRYLEEVTIHEASLVSFPAYEGTAGTTSIRSIDPSELADALLSLESGTDLSADQANLIRDVVSKLEQDGPVNPLDLLDIKQKQLALLAKSL